MQDEMLIFKLLKAQADKEEKIRKKKREPKPPEFTVLLNETEEAQNNDLALDKIILIVADNDAVKAEYIANTLPLSRVFELYAQMSALAYKPE